MSYVVLDIPVDQTELMVVPWLDPVVDDVGFEVRSEYVEMFWLNVIGPTALWLQRRLVHGFQRYPLGYEVDLADTAKALGVAYHAGANSPFMRALNRCVLFGVAQFAGGALAVRRKLPPVAARHLARMPQELRAAHLAWQRSSVDRASETSRARVLAAAMTAVGDDPEVIERQLLALGITPATATDIAALSA